MKKSTDKDGYMKRGKFLLLILLMAGLLIPSVFAVDFSDVTGLWKTIDDETGVAKAVIAIYEYQGKIFGRVLCSFDDTGTFIDDDMYQQIKTSPFLVGEPAFNGMDIIWDLEKKGKKFAKGKIMDPGDSEVKPRIYDSEIWREGNKLIVRGKILFIGRNQEWYPFDPKDFPAGFVIPDYENFVPEIPEVK